MGMTGFEVIVCESLIHGSSLMQNSWVYGRVSVALCMCCGVCKGCWRLLVRCRL